MGEKRDCTQTGTATHFYASIPPIPGWWSRDHDEGERALFPSTSLNSIQGMNYFTPCSLVVQPRAGHGMHSDSNLHSTHGLARPGCSTRLWLGGLWRPWCRSLGSGWFTPNCRTATGAANASLFATSRTTWIPRIASVYRLSAGATIIAIEGKAAILTNQLLVVAVQWNDVDRAANKANLCHHRLFMDPLAVFAMVFEQPLCCLSVEWSHRHFRSSKVQPNQFMQSWLAQRSTHWKGRGCRSMCPCPVVRASSKGVLWGAHSPGKIR